MDTKNSYDRVAEPYASHIAGELEHKPADREILRRFVREVADGPICDLGCGPGHVARFLAGEGATVTGIDLSPGMVAVARRLNPSIPFEVGDMRALEVGDGAWAGIVAFYSIIHLTPDELLPALTEMRRALRPGGSLLLTFHIGEEVRHIEEWWDQEVRLDFTFYLPERIEALLRQAGFTAIERIERDPYPEVEVQTRRAYIIAHKPPR
jgi:SAM-dependent methyltransferase